MRQDTKALLIPINPKQEIFLQDREGHKLPPWGFFGGSIEEGETPVAAVIRESKEELDVDILESELIDLGNFSTVFSDIEVDRRIFLWPTDQTEFTVLEGAGGVWLGYEEARAKLTDPERFDTIWDKIVEVI